MIIKANIPILVIRYSQINNISFIEEHEKIINENRFTWMLKTGKKIPDSSLDKVKDNGGFIILKAPKGVGGKFYVAHVLECNNGMPKSEYIYPNYYNNITSDFLAEPLDGTWFKVEKLEQLPLEKAENLLLCKNKKRIIDVIAITRTAVLYSYFQDEIEI